MKWWSNFIHCSGLYEVIITYVIEICANAFGLAKGNSSLLRVSLFRQGLPNAGPAGHIVSSDVARADIKVWDINRIYLDWKGEIDMQKVAPHLWPNSERGPTWKMIEQPWLCIH